MAHGAPVVIARSRGSKWPYLCASNAHRAREVPLTWGSAKASPFLPEASDVSDIASSPREYTVLGKIRLENRAQVRAMLGESVSASDLDLAGLLIEQRGVDGVRDLLGPFALVVWHRPTRQLWAARDAFGIETIYWKIDGETVAFSSSATALASTRSYDLDFVTAFLLRGGGCSDRSVFEGVRAVPPATVVRFEPTGQGAARGACGSR